jgi:predicted Zn-dependent peptidase
VTRYRRFAAFSLQLVAFCWLPAAGPATPVAARAIAADAAVSEFDVNGLKVLVKRRAGSQTVSAGLFFRGGAQNITAANAGIEALMLDVASEATAAFPRDRLRRELSRTGTQIGAGVNNDFSAITLGSTLQHFDEAWAVFVDAARHPSLAADDVDRVRNRFLIGLESINDTADGALDVETQRIVYAGHPYGINTHGTAASLKSITTADLQKFHARMMQTSRMLLVIVGDLDPERIRAAAATAFSGVPRGDGVPPPAPALSFTAPTVNITARALPTNYVRGVYAAPPPGSADYYPLLVANSILRGRIFEEVREKRALSYAPDAFVNMAASNIGGIYVTAVDANQAVTVMLREVEDLRTDAVDPREVRAAAQDFLTHYYIDEQSNAAQVGELARAELVGGGWRSAGAFLDRIRVVTAADVRRVASKYMRNLQFVVLGNPAQIDRAIFLRQGAGH